MTRRGGKAGERREAAVPAHPGGGVGGEADEGGLAEGGLAADAGQQHKPEGGDRGDADEAGEGGFIFGQHERQGGADEQREDGQDRGAGRGHLNVSPPGGGAVFLPGAWASLAPLVCLLAGCGVYGGDYRGHAVLLVRFSTRRKAEGHRGPRRRATGPGCLLGSFALAWKRRGGAGVAQAGRGLAAEPANQDRRWRRRPFAFSARGRARRGLKALRAKRIVFLLRGPLWPSVFLRVEILASRRAGISKLTRPHRGRTPDNPGPIPDGAEWRNS